MAHTRHDSLPLSLSCISARKFGRSQPDRTMLMAQQRIELNSWYGVSTFCSLLCNPLLCYFSAILFPSFVRCLDARNELLSIFGNINISLQLLLLLLHRCMTKKNCIQCITIMIMIFKNNIVIDNIYGRWTKQSEENKNDSDDLVGHIFT